MQSVISNVKFSVSMNDTLAKQPFCYATVQSNGTLDLTALANHMGDHNCPFSKGTISGILVDAPDHMVELLKAGYRVQLGDLGTFYLKIESHSYRLDEKGNKIQITKTGDFTANQIDGVRICFDPGKACQVDKDEITFERVLTKKAQAESEKTNYPTSGSGTGGGTSLS